MLGAVASIARTSPPRRASVCCQSYGPDFYSPLEASTHLSEQSSSASNIKTPLPLQPLSGALGRLAFRILMPSLERPLGLVVRVQRDLLANELDTFRIHAVKETKFALLVPPVLGELGEVRDLIGVDRVEVSAGEGSEHRRRDGWPRHSVPNGGKTGSGAK